MYRPVIRFIPEHVWSSRDWGLGEQLPPGVGGHGLQRHGEATQDNQPSEDFQRMQRRASTTAGHTTCNTAPQQHWWPSILDSPSSFCISGNFRVVKLLCFIASCHNIFMDWDYPQSLLWQMTYDLWPIQNKMELKYVYEKALSIILPFQFHSDREWQSQCVSCSAEMLVL